MKNEHIIWAYAPLTDGTGHVVMIGVTDEGIREMRENKLTLLANPPGRGFANVAQIVVFHEKDKATLKQRLRESGVPVSEVN